MVEYPTYTNIQIKEIFNRKITMKLFKFLFPLRRIQNFVHEYMIHCVNRLQYSNYFDLFC